MYDKYFYCFVFNFNTSDDFTELLDQISDFAFSSVDSHSKFSDFLDILNIFSFFS